MSTEKIDIGYVAALARLALTPDEIERFGVELGDLLNHVNALAKLDVSAVAATAQVVASRNVERDDAIRPGLEHGVVMEQAPARQGEFFRVPRIIAE